MEATPSFAAAAAAADAAGAHIRDVPSAYMKPNAVQMLIQQEDLFISVAGRTRGKSESQQHVLHHLVIYRGSLCQYMGTHYLV